MLLRKTRRRPYGRNVSGDTDSSLSLDVPTRDLSRLQHQDHPDHRLAHTLLRSARVGRIYECRQPCSASSRVPRQGSPPTSIRIETASPLKRRSEGLRRMSTKVSRPVLRGPGPSNGVRLLGVKADVAALLTFLVLCGSPHFRRKFCVRIAQERGLAAR